MLLSKLKEYADERMEERLPPLYARTPIAWLVELRADGQPLVSRPTDMTDSSTARRKRGQDMVAPVIQRASGIKPLLLADNGEYTFGRARDPNKQERAIRAHAAYRELLDQAAGETKEKSVLAVQRFYELGGPDLLELGEGWDYGLKVTFEVNFEDGTRQRPIDLSSVQEFWISVNAPASDSVDQCLVCGERKPTLDRLQAKVKGVRGGQSSGTSIISANLPAFESYGLKASRTSPTCRECGEQFTRGLNDLIAGEKTSLFAGGTTFIFWTRDKKTDFDLANLLRDPEPAQVRALLNSFRSGRSEHNVDEASFYAASLSGSGGRTVVRDWLDTTIGEVKQNVARWFALQNIADPRDGDPMGENPRPLSLFRLAVSTVRNANELPVTTPRALFRTALQGTPLAMDIAFLAIRRNRSEQGVRRERAALIKIVLLSHELQLPKEDYMVALEPEHQEPAYHCGRLLAVIESVQYAALGRVNTTVVDRYYGAASSMPAIVFGSLLRGAQPHLSKLAARRRGGLQNRLMEICDQIGGFPKTLSLEQQALFSLGYYHQRAHDRAEANSRRAERAAE